MQKWISASEKDWMCGTISLFFPPYVEKVHRKNRAILTKSASALCFSPKTGRANLCRQSVCRRRTPLFCRGILMTHRKRDRGESHEPSGSMLPFCTVQTKSRQFTADVHAVPIFGNLRHRRQLGCGTRGPGSGRRHCERSYIGKKYPDAVCRESCVPLKRARDLRRSAGYLAGYLMEGGLCRRKMRKTRLSSSPRGFYKKEAVAFHAAASFF